MNICVIHATAGAGHKKAAEAIFKGLKDSGHQSRIIDALAYTNPFFQATYPTTYAYLVTKLPFVWAIFFGLLDQPWLQPAVAAVRRLYNGFNARRLEQFLIKEAFDIIITTQFLSAEVTAYLKRAGKIKAKVMCVVTDFDVHRIWINQGIDLYCAACPYTKEKIVCLGVPSERVFVTGIPTDADFSKHLDLPALKGRLGVREGMFTVLIATGSFGMGPIEDLMDSLQDEQLLVVCGHNKRLFERLKAKAGNNARIFGLVDNMHELMAVADVMVTKPGGLSIAEALVKKLPMLFFSAIPGQETQNIVVLKKYGAAQEQQPIRQIVRTIQAWKASPQDYTRVRQSLTVLSKPNAVADIIRLI